MRRAEGIFERATGFHALIAAARRAAKANALSQDATAFMFALEPNVLALQRALRAHDYRPAPYRTFQISEPKRRTISAAAFVDRVVHHALCAQLAPIFERVALSHSHACRSGHGPHHAVRHAQRAARRWPWFAKLDVQSFFETADHCVLKALLARWIADVDALWLCARFIDAGAPGSLPGQGLPIGNLTSQHFANAYLTPLDRFVKQGLRVPAAVRYMDDVLLFGPDKATVRHWAVEVERFVGDRLCLQLRADAARLAPVRTGVPFLGFRIWPALIRLDAARVRRFRRGVRQVQRDAGLSVSERVQRVEARIAWVSLADTVRFRRSFFARLDTDGLLRDVDPGEG